MTPSPAARCVRRRADRMRDCCSLYLALDQRPSQQAGPRRNAEARKVRVRRQRSCARIVRCRWTRSRRSDRVGGPITLLAVLGWRATSGDVRGTPITDQRTADGVGGGKLGRDRARLVVGCVGYRRGNHPVRRDAPSDVADQAEVQTLGMRPRALGGLRDGLKRFGAAMADPTVDYVTATLLIASERSSGVLHEQLSEAASVAREQVSVRERVDASRSRVGPHRRPSSSSPS